MYGTMHGTEAADSSQVRLRGVVGEHSVTTEGSSRDGLDGTEEIMSERVARRQARILPTENLRIPGEGSSAQG